VSVFSFGLGGVRIHGIGLVGVQGQRQKEEEGEGEEEEERQ